MRGLRVKATTDRPDRIRDRRDIFTEIRNGAEIHLRNAKRSSIPHQASSPRPQYAKNAFRPREIQRFSLRPQLHKRDSAVQAFSSVTGSLQPSNSILPTGNSDTPSQISSLDTLQANSRSPHK